ncbi:hypothetical protein A9Q83_16600 [Alphaproteobacteria bacterium 46_93_T64]|nr:hypothetical protein A9Q83_16600 [Alphaproteobacteria bacterium 46_93_T64]
MIKTFLFGLFVLSFYSVPSLGNADELSDLENRVKFLKEMKVIEANISTLQNQKKILMEKYNIKSNTTTIQTVNVPKMNGDYTGNWEMTMKSGDGLCQQFGNAYDVKIKNNILTAAAPHQMAGVFYVKAKVSVDGQIKGKASGNISDPAIASGKINGKTGVVKFTLDGRENCSVTWDIKKMS